MSTNYNLTQFGFTSSTIFIIHYSLKLQTRSMAAAYAALVSLFNDLEDIKNHPRHSFFFDKNQIQSLLESVTFLIEFMESYDNCHGPSKDAAQLLERRITFAARAAEEVIESHVVEQIRGGSTLDGKKRSPRFLLDLEKVIQDMDYVRRKSIKVQQARIGLQVRQPAYSTPASSSTVPLTSQKTTMVGFDDLLLQLSDQLTGQPSSRRVIPIVGTGGVGKTTLAQNAFESPLIVQHFDVRLWVTISQQYVVRDILLTLLSRKGESTTTETVGELGEQLHKSLYGRRYLIVLDDMWSVRAWDEMMSLFPDTGNGSRIVVTTRQSNVADYIGSSPLAVSLLGDDESWDLFCEKVFGGEDCPRELKDVGKNIVRKCKGLPVAIVVVAGHLGKSSRTQECWENIANNMKSVLNSEENEHLFNILSFSYIHLPIRLKPCFVYLGTYAEDELIDVSDLIRRWIAEGFVKSCNTENLEEIAEDYLKDLIDRNLILDHGTNFFENSSYCKIHDVLRELCLKVTEKEMFFNVVDGGRVICRERGVAIKEKKREENDDPQVIYTPRSVPLVRSLRKWRTSDELSFDLGLCRLLSVDKVNEGFREDLQHVNLRYLKCDEGLVNEYSYFSSSISLFWNLQTLIVTGRNRSSVIALNEIWEMVQLRHLEVDPRIDLPNPLPGDKLEEANELVMRNLHTLLIVNNFTMSEEICKRVPNIKKLQLEYYDEVRSYYCPHNLVLLRKLESLDLRIYNDDSGWREYGLSLTFPNSLKELTLWGCRLDWEEMTMMIGSLPHLEILFLDYNSVIGSEWSLVEGKFLRLKFLSIYNSDQDLVKWNVDSSHFPVLEDLNLFWVSRLDELPSEIGAIPTLRSISLYDCSISLVISAVRMLVEQEEDHGNEGLRLRVTFWDVDQEEVESFNKKMEEEGLTPNNLYLYGRKWHK